MMDAIARGLAAKALAQIATVSAESQIRQMWMSGQRTGGVWSDTQIIDIFVDSVSGNDANAGTIDAPKKTVAAVTQAPGMVIGVKRGSVFRETVALTVDNVSLVAYGSASSARPVILNSTKVTGTWTNTSGNIWSITLATAPDTVLLISAFTEGGCTKLWKYATTQTAPAVGQFGYAAGTLYVYSTVDPGTLAEVGYTVNGGTVALALSANGHLAQDIAIWGSTTDGLFIGQDLTGSTVRGCHLAANTSDGCGGGGHKNFLCEYNIVEDNGYAARDGTGADGDGFSFHGDAAARYATGVIRYNIIRRNRKSGLGNQSSCIVDCYGNYLDNNYWNIAVFVTTFTGSASLQHRFWNNVCVRRSNDNSSWVINTAPTIPLALRYWSNTNFSTVITANISGFRPVESVNLTLEMKNNIVSGFDRGLDLRGSTLCDLDYNSYFGNTANYFDNSTGYLTGKTGTHSITADPKFVDTTGPNLRLKATSPCAGAGVGVGLTEDFRRRPVSSPPDIGAMQVGAPA